jgi:hypothetical protein
MGRNKASAGGLPLSIAHANPADGKESGACVKYWSTARVSMIEEPGAGKPHAGIWAGGVGQPAFLLQRATKI